VTVVFVQSILTLPLISRDIEAEPKTQNKLFKVFLHII